MDIMSIFAAVKIIIMEKVETIGRTVVKMWTTDIDDFAREQIGNLANSDSHSTTMMSSVDLNMFHKLGINLTCEPIYETKKLYHR